MGSISRICEGSTITVEEEVNMVIEITQADLEDVVVQLRKKYRVLRGLEVSRDFTLIRSVVTDDSGSDELFMAHRLLEVGIQFLIQLHGLSRLVEELLSGQGLVPSLAKILAEESGEDVSEVCWFSRVPERCERAYLVDGLSRYGLAGGNLVRGDPAPFRSVLLPRTQTTTITLEAFDQTHAMTFRLYEGLIECTFNGEKGEVVEADDYAERILQGQPPMLTIGGKRALLFSGVLYPTEDTLVLTTAPGVVITALSPDCPQTVCHAYGLPIPHGV